MTTNFNSVQMLETSENCYKFSESVSYETLVGGTATTGRGIKQNRRLFLSSAIKPLRAVGTFSAFHNAEKVVEKILQMSPIFKLVKIISLTVLSISMVSESQAEGTKVICINGLREDGVTACEKCGDNCNWKIEDGALSVFGSGNMYNYEYKTVNGQNRYVNSSTNKTPWEGYNIETIDIEGVNNVGKGVFAFMTGVKSVNIKSPVRDILSDAFWGTHSLETVTLSDSVNTIGQGSFWSDNLKNIVIPDTVNSIIPNAFGKNLDSLNNLNIVCLGGKKTCENIKQLLKKYTYYTPNGWKTMDISNKVSKANYQQCNSTNYYWNGAECVREPDVTKRKCCSSCKDMGGWCNRIRYTPAEAAEVLHDDNTNEVTITFRK